VPIPQLVIFDCDGVLVDSEPISLSVLIDIVAEAGGDLDRQSAHDRFLGRSMASVVEMLRDEHGVNLGHTDLEDMRQRLYEKFRKELEPINGIAEAVRNLPVRYCVASSSQVERIELSLEVTGLLPLFKGRIFSSSMVCAGKPAPDLFLHASRALGVAPSRCVVIEDSPTGVLAAKAAGMTVFAFTGGGHAAGESHRAALGRAGPDRIFSDMRELPAMLGFEAAKGQPVPLPGEHVIAVDVGTSSARAALFDRNGRLLARNEHPIRLWRDGADVAEHDSEDIWRAVCIAVRDVVDAGGGAPEKVAAIGFDATCSLVIRDHQGQPVTVSRTGDSSRDTIVWLDHRAHREADECTATGHAVLAHAGGTMSPEMQIPKLMWLKRNLNQSWSRMAHAFDLADFLTWKATGSTSRSQCTLTCKWTYRPHETEAWSSSFLASVGLHDLIEKAGLPASAAPIGSCIGPLTQHAATELGLTKNCKVAAGLIDAYGGALGVLGSRAAQPSAVENHMGLIAGTSSCVMTFSPQMRFIKGAWGPYLGVAVPGLWMNEGGQSATGALLDHVIRVHAAGREPTVAMHAAIIKRIGELREEEGESLARRLHVLPDFHGNRSPLADPHALGVVSGLAIDSSFDGLCRLYWRTAISIALGIRHILENLAAHGQSVSMLHVTGGHVRNPLLMELYADATGCTVSEPVAEDATLLGTAMAAAAAAGIFTSVAQACAAMDQGSTVRKGNTEAAARFEIDYRAFLAMHRHRAEIEEIVSGAG
jgi:FGGY-family pentulose kinase/HAD superfamily hydrolase (TIGR01509 family)